MNKATMMAGLIVCSLLSSIASHYSVAAMTTPESDEHMPFACNKQGVTIDIEFDSDNILDQVNDALTMMVNAGLPRAQATYELGTRLIQNTKTQPLAMSMLEEAADANLKEAQVKLGMINYYGVYRAPDYAEAYRRMSQAAAQGSDDASYRLGIMLMKGQGVNKNVDRAMEIMRSLAQKDYPYAKCTLGKAYYSGKMVEKDQKKAMEYFLSAADKGCSVSRYMIGIMYLEGEGVAKDEQAAFKWIYQAATIDRYSQARAVLGKLYVEGIGTKRNTEEGVRLLTDACMTKEHTGCEYLADVYETGKFGVSIDKALAQQMRQRVAKDLK